MPKEIRTDNEKSFIGNEFNEWLKRLNIVMSNAGSYAHFQNGQSERVQRFLNEQMRIILDPHAQSGKAWNELLPEIAMRYNATWNATIKCEPYFVVFGKRPRLTWEDSNYNAVLSSEQIRALEEDCIQFRTEEIKRGIKEGRLSESQYVDEGDLVWWFPKDKGKKFNTYWGPYEVLKTEGRAVAKIKDWDTGTETTVAVRDLYYCL